MRLPGPLAAWFVSFVAAACGSTQQRLVVAGDGFVVFSLFDKASTDAWRRQIEADVNSVAALLRTGVPDPPVRIHLDVTTQRSDASLLEQLDPSLDGVRGWTSGGREIHLVVRSDGDGLISTRFDATLRHELAHVHLHRLGAELQPWFDEGFADEIGDAVRASAGLRLDPAPVQLVLARALCSRLDLSEVWTWDGGRTAPREHESVLRAVARSVVRFLLNREGGDVGTATVARLVAVRPASDPSLVAAWRSWLEGLDFAVLVERGIHDPDPRIRTAAANSLPSLADVAQRLRASVPGVAGAVDMRTDRVALEALSDVSALEPAARYLVYFRARSLAAESMRVLDEHVESPTARIVGFAVRARRGEPGGPSDVRATWDRLDPETRVRLDWIRTFLPDIDAPSH